MEKADIFAMYYSFIDNEGIRTLSLQYCDKDYCKSKPYYISANGGVPMLWMNEEDVTDIIRECIKQKIKIDTINAR